MTNRSCSVTTWTLRPNVVPLVSKTSRTLQTPTYSLQKNAYVVKVPCRLVTGRKSARIRRRRRTSLRSTPRQAISSQLKIPTSGQLDSRCSRSLRELRATAAFFLPIPAAHHLRQTAFGSKRNQLHPLHLTRPASRWTHCFPELLPE